MILISGYLNDIARLSQSKNRQGEDYYREKMESVRLRHKLSAHVLDKFDWIKWNLIVWNYRTGRPAKETYRNEAGFLWFYSNPLHEINIDAVRIPYDEGGEKDKRKNPKGKSCGNVWEFPRIMPNYKEATGHPTQKPEKLAERMLLASSRAGDLVVIPFAGSGSEVVQCIKNGRDFIASEINESYVGNIILPRLQKETDCSVSAQEKGGFLCQR